VDEAREAQGGCGRASGAGEATREAWRGGGDAQKAVLEKAIGGGAAGARGTEERKREKK
jgi:hypothetical protein